MALKLSGLFHTNVSDMQRGEKTSAAKTEGDAGKVQQREAALKELAPGRVIRGEIVGKNGQEIQIRIAKDVVIHARMDQDIQASEGQKVTFEVRSNVSGVISLRPLFQNMSQENNALKALVQAGIESDAKSIQMVSAMMQEGMSIGKEALQGMYKALMGIPESEVSNAVQMNRLQIPVNPESLEQFSAYKNYEHKLLSAFSQVAEEIPGEVSRLFAEGSFKEGTVLIDKILTMFEGNGLEQTGISGQSETVLTEAGEGVQKGNTLPETEIGGRSGAVLEEIEVSGQSEGVLPKVEISGQSEGILSKAEGSGQSEATLPKAEGNGQPEAALSNVEADGQDKAVLPEAKLVLNAGEREQLTELVKDAGGDREALAMLQNGSIDREELYQLVRSLAKMADTPEKQNAVKELFVSEGFQKLLKEKIESQWTLKTPEHLEKESVSRLYERLNEQTRQLTEALSNMGKAESPLAKSVQNIRENVDFLNQLNQLYTYVQLPLKLNSSNAHGDLYVYTNKKNLAKKDGNISAFLHLDMEHLGMVDVYVMMEQERISTNFYLEDEESLTLLEKNMDILTKRLTEKGYQAECTLTLKDKPGNAMEELIATDKNISMISEQSFDVRA